MPFIVFIANGKSIRCPSDRHICQYKAIYKIYIVYNILFAFCTERVFVIVKKNKSLPAEQYKSLEQSLVISFTCDWSTEDKVLSATVLQLTEVFVLVCFADKNNISMLGNHNGHILYF